MDEFGNKSKKKLKQQVKPNSAKYLKQREKANAGERRFLDKMTLEH